MSICGVGCLGVRVGGIRVSGLECKVWVVQITFQDQVCIVAHVGLAVGNLAIFTRRSGWGISVCGFGVLGLRAEGIRLFRKEWKVWVVQITFQDQFCKLPLVSHAGASFSTFPRRSAWGISICAFVLLGLLADDLRLIRTDRHVRAVTLTLHFPSL